MPEISYNDLNDYLKKTGKSGLPTVFLIYGEEVLYKTALDTILNALIPSNERNIRYEPVDNDSVYEAIEKVNTFSLLGGTKVIALCDSRIFYSKQDQADILEKAKIAYDAKDLKKAAKCIAGLLGTKNLSFEDVAEKEQRFKNFNIDTEDDYQWLDEVIGYGVHNHIKISAQKDEPGLLQKAIEEGFPQSNSLIITADLIDKRLRLYKAVEAKGLIIDCSVPKGNRMADRTEQEAVLKERMKAILSQHGKNIDSQAFRAVYDMTGFDIRTFSSNIEKLVSYVGTRPSINIDDVNAILERTRQDPIYELTGAVSDRKPENALFFLDSLLSAGYFPLQILSAITSQFRKLIIAKGFLESPLAKVWHVRMPYQQFQNKVMPVITEYDRTLLNHLEEWERMESESGEADKEKKKKKSKDTKSLTDILIARTSSSSYPVYQILQCAEKFSKAELILAFEMLYKADIQIKTTGRDSKFIMEEVIFRICNRVSGFDKNIGN